MSTAYTVKSLPGAYLYMPVTDANVNIQSVSSSMPSVKRTLSDPEIHFTNPLTGHPVILTVKPTSEISGQFRGCKTNYSFRSKINKLIHCFRQS